MKHLIFAFTFVMATAYAAADDSLVTPYPNLDMASSFMLVKHIDKLCELKKTKQLDVYVCKQNEKRAARAMFAYMRSENRQPFWDQVSACGKSDGPWFTDILICAQLANYGYPKD